MPWWDPFDELHRMHRELHRMFHHFVGPIEEKLEYLAPAARTPLANIYETDSTVVAEFELPGVAKEDIELLVSENQIEVRTRKHKEERELKKGYYRYEAAAAQYYRLVTLPAKVVPEKAEASYKEGVLRVEIPKIELKKEEKAKKISVK